MNFISTKNGDLNTAAVNLEFVTRAYWYSLNERWIIRFVMQDSYEEWFYISQETMLSDYNGIISSGKAL